MYFVFLGTTYKIFCTKPLNSQTSKNTSREKETSLY